ADERGVRCPRGSSLASRVARLAGVRIDGRRVGSEVADAGAGAQPDLPPDVASRRRVRGSRSGECLAGARPARAVDRRDGPRPGAPDRGAALAHDVRPAGPAATAEHGAEGGIRRRYRLEYERGPGSLPPRAVYHVATIESLSIDGHV